MLALKGICRFQDFKKIGEFLDRCCQIALKIQSEKGKKLKDFEAHTHTHLLRNIFANSDV